MQGTICIITSTEKSDLIPPGVVMGVGHDFDPSPAAGIPAEQTQKTNSFRMAARQLFERYTSDIISGICDIHTIIEIIDDMVARGWISITYKSVTI